jgi:hypothetical protein
MSVLGIFMAMFLPRKQVFDFFEIPQKQRVVL